MSLLTDNQLNQIVWIVIDTYGDQLTDEEVSEAIGLILEDVAGIETLNDRSLDKLITKLKDRYYDYTNQ